MHSKPNITQIIADRFISELDKGVAPWSRGFQSSAPRNAFRRNEYRGINYFLLSMLGIDNACTYKQAADAGGNVKKGAKGVPVVFWKFLDKKGTGDASQGIAPEKFPMMRYYTVFSIADTENTGWIAPASVGDGNQKIESAETLFAKVQAVCGFHVVNGGNQPSFCPATNSIAMPTFERWAQVPRFYKTLFHEAGHALGKVTGKQFANGGEAYATEELIAELFASVALNMLGINCPECWDNSVAYVQGWSKRLTDEPQAIISAAQEAQKRLDLVFPRQTGAATEHGEETE